MPHSMPDGAARRDDRAHDAAPWERARDAVRALARRLDEAGVRAALAFLNARTRFRFTGIYRREGDLLRAVAVYDRENPGIATTGACPYDDTYCAITIDGAAPFATDDAARDPRLHDHAARLRVISYSGVPIRLASGRVWGSLCHHDVRPRLLTEPERRLLEEGAPLFARALAPADQRPGA